MEDQMETYIGCKINQVVKMDKNQVDRQQDKLEIDLLDVNAPGYIKD